MAKIKGKHLTIGQRVRIEAGLNSNEPIRKIARDIHKSASTVHREIKRHTMVLSARANDCAFKDGCRLTRLCEIQYCSSICSVKCSGRCCELCDKYAPAKCEALLSAPYVCNGCRGFSSCSYERRIYRANLAQNRYRSTLVDTRTGFDLTEEELNDLNDLVSPLIRQGQSPYHIMASHGDEIKLSLPTLYKLIESGLLNVGNIDLKQQVRRKPRKRPRKGRLHNEVSAITVSKAGHLYEDFLLYMEENESMHVQMDCVEGKSGDSATLLTLHYPDYHMQLAFYLEKQNSNSVIEALNSVEKALGTELFKVAFPVILTDNGVEFSDIDGMEFSCIDPAIRRTKVFFCEPNRSDEKGACENNHKLIRDIIPKGTSLEPYDQSDITMMMNHINSYRRRIAFGKSPYDICVNIFPKQFFRKLDLKRISDDEVTLSPTTTIYLWLILLTSSWDVIHLVA